MPKAGAFDAQLQYLRNKLPQLGFFSTLDELIHAAPQERMPAQQWQQYLQPGRTLTREGINFPLKAEELQYSGLGDLAKEYPTGALDKATVAGYVQKMRPEFNIRANTQGVPGIQRYPQERTFISNDPSTQGDILRRMPIMGEAQYPEHAHEAGIPNSYEENITQSPDFGSFPSHFSPQDISWSRTTRHPAEGGTIARLIEEIQSDRHEAAAERLSNVQGTEFITNPGRRGYRTPEEEQQLTSLITGQRGTGQAFWGNREAGGVANQLSAKPPNTPFKDPAEYALLELKKQLLNSVNQGDSYLALTRGADQVQRYEQGMGGGKGEGMSYIYDKVYPSALKKLAAQYGANVSDLPLALKGATNQSLPQTMLEHGVDTPYDLLSQVDPYEYHQRASSLLKEYLDQLPRNLRNKNSFLQATSILDSFPEGDYPPEDRIEDLEYSLGKLHNEWLEQNQGKAISMQKTFPAMHITPEVADKVKKAGVPLFTIAGATALGLGNSDNANANVVEDAALQQDNSGMAGGGQVTFALRRLLAQLGENPEIMQKSAAQRLSELGKRVLPNPTVVDPAAAKTTGQQIADQAIANATTRKATTMQTPDVLAQRLQSGFVDPSELNHLLYTDPQTTSLISVYQGGIDKNALTPETKNALIARLQSLGITNPPQIPQKGMASGGQITPYPFSGNTGPEDLIRSALMRLGLPAPDTLEDASPSIQLPNSFYTWGPEIQTRGFAEGGSATVHEDQPEQDPDSSLAKISDFLKRYGGSHVQRVGTGIAKQFYGTDRGGHLVLGGRAWTTGQGGTPAGILDQFASIPKTVEPIINYGLEHNPMVIPGLQGGYEAPEWSSDAAARLAALDKRVTGVTGVREAQTLPEHVEDAAAMLATPFPAAKVAKEAPMLQRALEFLTPVRPPTLARYGTDAAALGGTSAALDTLVKRLADRTPPPDNAVAADPQIEQAALEATNASGHAEGGQIMSSITDLLGKISNPATLKEFLESHTALQDALMKANPPLTEIDKAKLAKHARGPQAPMTVRVAVHPEQEADPDFLSSPQFEQQVKTQLASTLHDEHYLHPALADTFSLTGETHPSNLSPVAREWNKALGIDIAPAPKLGPVKEYDVGVTGPSKIVNQITGGED